MYHLAGEYECKIDTKGRLKLPAGLLKQLGDHGLNFTINRGLKDYLVLYPELIWTKKTKEIDQLNYYLEEDRQFLRYFYAGATKVVADNSERILIPKRLLQHAGLERELILLAYQEQIEIWAKNRYEAEIYNEPKDYSALAQKIFSAKQLRDSHE